MNQQADQLHADPVSNLYETGITLVYIVASIFTQPVEYWIRPNFGTRYFHPVITFFAFALMSILTGVAAFAGSVGNMIPFHRPSAPTGFINFNMFFVAYFFTGVYHNFRTWRLMIHPEMEEHSRFENSGLPFFRLLPRGRKHYFVRIVWEPAIVLGASIVLSRLGIIDHFVALYLTFATLMLFAKNSVMWYRTWEHVRDILDLRNKGPIIAKVVEGTATDDELASIQLSRFPKDVAPEIKKAAAADLAGLPPDIERLISPVGRPV